TTAFLEAAGLSHDAAQEAREYANGEVAAYREKLNTDWTTLTQKTWVDEAKTDPEIGGDKFTGAVAEAQRFLKLCADEGTIRFLEETGFGNHKQVIRMLSRAMKRIAGESGGTPRKSDAEVLYGNTRK